MLNTNQAPSGGSKYEPLEPGNYPGRVVRVIDMGLQPQNPWAGKEKEPREEVMVTYELPTEFLKDEDGADVLDKPRWLSENIPVFNLEADKSRCAKRFQALDPTGLAKGDFSNLLNAPCTLTVVVNTKKGDPSKVYNNIGGVTPPMKGFVIPPLIGKAKVFDLASPDMELFKELPEWVREKIVKNLNYQGSPLHRILSGSAPLPPAPEVESGDADPSDSEETPPWD